MSLDIRIAAGADAERVTTLARDTFVATFADSNTPEDMAHYVEQAFAVEAILSEIMDTAATFFWAEEKGIPAGYAKLYRGVAQGCVTGSRAVEMQRIYAAPEFVGAGVGKALLQICTKTGRAEGFETLWLGVWEHNDRALEFYQRQGFVDVGEQPFLLGADLQTDRIMQLDLRR